MEWFTFIIKKWELFTFIFPYSRELMVCLITGDHFLLFRVSLANRYIESINTCTVTHSWPIGVESKGAISVIGTEPSCKPKGLQHRTWSSTQLPTPTLQEKEHTDSISLPLQHPKTAGTWKMSRTFHWTACPLFPCSFPKNHRSHCSQLT